MYRLQGMYRPSAGSAVVGSEAVSNDGLHRGGERYGRDLLLMVAGLQEFARDRRVLDFG
jgi:hypothetical protein